MSIDSAPSAPDPRPEPAPPLRNPLARIGVDWATVIVAAVLVILAIAGLLPSIPFLVS